MRERRIPAATQNAERPAGGAIARAAAGGGTTGSSAAGEAGAASSCASAGVFGGSVEDTRLHCTRLRASPKRRLHPRTAAMNVLACTPDV